MVIITVGDSKILETACSNGHENIVKKLLNLVPVRDHAAANALKKAAMKGHYGVVIQRLKNTAVVEYLKNNPESIKVLWEFDAFKEAFKQQTIYGREMSTFKLGVSAIVNFMKQKRGCATPKINRENTPAPDGAGTFIPLTFSFLKHKKIRNKVVHVKATNTRSVDDIKSMVNSALKSTNVRHI